MVQAVGCRLKVCRGYREPILFPPGDLPQFVPDPIPLKIQFPFGNRCAVPS